MPNAKAPLPPGFPALLKVRIVSALTEHTRCHAQRRIIEARSVKIV
jgi:hypothetical protein